ncbi:MAG: hypothetical protein LUC90_02515 [Lachnospiraceae bacterium]|nr:hypothetical protein [Lachnospiraceae bacterium]
MNHTITTIASTPYPPGIRRQGCAVRASFVSQGTDCGVILKSINSGVEELRIPFDEAYRCGSVYSMQIENVPEEYTLAAFYEEDRIVPDKNGVHFTKHPYGEELTPSQMESILPDKKYDWENTVRPAVPFSQAVFYGLHVRGFTQHPSSECRYKGTFAGVMEKLDYLQELGVTSLLLQPAYEFIESIKSEGNGTAPNSVSMACSVDQPQEGVLYKNLSQEDLLQKNPLQEDLPQKDLSQKIPSQEDLSQKDLSQKNSLQEDLPQTEKKNLNYWGYQEGFYYAPKASYAAGEDAVTEFKDLVKTCHVRGMELLMQFYFPRSVNEREILPILEHWALEYQVDGFQIMADHINMEIIRTAPLLSDVKLIYYGFEDTWIADRSTGIRKGGPLTKRLCVFNEGPMIAYRRFLKGDEHTLNDMMEVLKRNGRSVAYMNSIADYNTLRVNDLVSYNCKHNEDNGEDNRDGSDYNHSWNCGEEGLSCEEEVNALREKQKKNIFAMLALSQGTPYLYMGDEMSKTQKGNNNPYNQDNETVWVNWQDLKKNEKFYQFVKELLTFRRDHPILHMEQPLTGADVKGLGYPDISFHGEEAYMTSFEADRRELGVLLNGAYARNHQGKPDSLLFVAFNMHWQTHECALPILRKGMHWQPVFATEELPEDHELERTLTVPARTACVLEAVREPGAAEVPVDDDRTGF